MARRAISRLIGGGSSLGDFVNVFWFVVVCIYVLFTLFSLAR